VCRDAYVCRTAGGVTSARHLSTVVGAASSVVWLVFDGIFRVKIAIGRSGLARSTLAELGHQHIMINPSGNNSSSRLLAARTACRMTLAP
jgi:hypothetical protein